jgi:hypothetical protein
MKRIIAVIAICLLGAISVANAGVISSLKPYFAVEMLNGNRFDIKDDNGPTSEPGVSYGTSRGMNYRFGVTPLPFVSVEIEYVQWAGFLMKIREMDYLIFKPSSYSTNLKMRPLELFLKNPVLSPYFICGMGTTSVDFLNPRGNEKVPAGSFASTKIGCGIDVRVNKNLYLYSELSLHDFTFFNRNFFWHELDISYSVVSIGAGYKF